MTYLARPWPLTIAMAALLFSAAPPGGAAALGPAPGRPAARGPAISAVAERGPAPMSLHLARSLNRPRVHAWVIFRDKGAQAATNEAAALSRVRAGMPQRTLWRRSKTMGAAAVDALDLPVDGAYVDQVLQTGARRRNLS